MGILRGLTLFPLAYRDLARALRHRRAVPRRFRASVIPTVTTVVFLVFAYDGDSRSIGRFLYFALLAFGLFQVTALPGDVNAELVGEQRRNGTLGLLYLAGLSSVEIFAGQLAGGAMIALNRFIALLPCLLLPFVMHGIPWSGYVVTVETLICWSVLCTALRVFSATVFIEGTAAELFSQAALLLLGGGLYLLSGLNMMLTGNPLSVSWLEFSPAHSIFVLFRKQGAVEPDELLMANLVTFLLAAVFLISASLVLRGSWQEEIYGEQASGWRRWRAQFRGRRRAQLRERWLDSAPYAWLAARHPGSFASPWIWLTVTLLAWSAGLLAWREYWLLPVNLWLMALLLGVLVRWTLHYSVAQQIAEDRTNNTLELLLTTPLSPRNIVEGEERLWRSHTVWIYRIVAAAYLLFYVLGAVALRKGPLGFGSYTCIWIGVFFIGPWVNPPGIWTTFWVCLNVGRPGYALKKFLWQGSGFVSVGIQFVLNADKLKVLPYGTPLEFGICLFVTGALAIAAYTTKRGTTRYAVRDKILSDLRFIATEPLPERDDPRLKRWNITDRLFRRMHGELALEERFSETRMENGAA